MCTHVSRRKCLEIRALSVLLLFPTSREMKTLIIIDLCVHIDSVHMGHTANIVSFILISE
jgi:hypothetical protein